MLTPQQVKATLGKLGLSQSKAAKLLGYHPRTVAGWCQGRGVVPLGIEKVLRYWTMVPEALANFQAHEEAKDKMKSQEG